MKKLLFAFLVAISFTFVCCDKNDEHNKPKDNDVRKNGIYGTWYLFVNDDEKYVFIFEDYNTVKYISYIKTTDGNELVDYVYGSYIYDKPNVTINLPGNTQLHGTYCKTSHYSGDYIDLYNSSNEKIGKAEASAIVTTMDLLSNYIIEPITESFSLIGNWYDLDGNLQLQIFEDGSYTRPGYSASHDFKWEYNDDNRELVFTNTASKYICICKIQKFSDGTLKMFAQYRKSWIEQPYEFNFHTIKRLQ